MFYENKVLNSLPIHYYIAANNNKPLLLFIHPAFANHHAFDKQLTAFSKDFRVTSIDLIGHGHSQGFKTSQKIDATPNHIKELLAIEGYHKVHLVGVSVGALIAQAFANANPKAVLSLTSLGGYDINNYDVTVSAQQNKQQFIFILKALISINWFSIANAKISAQSKEAQAEFKLMNQGFKRRSLLYMTSLVAIMNQYTTNKRAYPLLILVGISDSQLAIDLAQSWHEREPDSHFYLIEHAGHCANMDNPATFHQILTNHLLPS